MSLMKIMINGGNFLLQCVGATLIELSCFVIICEFVVFNVNVPTQLEYVPAFFVHVVGEVGAVYLWSLGMNDRCMCILMVVCQHLCDHGCRVVTCSEVASIDDARCVHHHGTWFTWPLLR